MGYEEYDDPRDNSSKIERSLIQASNEGVSINSPEYLSVNDPDNYEDESLSELYPKHVAKTRGEIMGRPDMSFHPGRSVDRESMSTMFEAMGGASERFADDIEREPNEKED